MDIFLRMSDLRVTYRQHRQYGETPGARGLGSPVRIFTSLPLGRLPLPGPEYRDCHDCGHWVHVTNLHCPLCRSCPSKDGRTYRHCQLCGRCVKPTYRHCQVCNRCCLPQHSCQQTGTLNGNCQQTGKLKENCQQTGKLKTNCQQTGKLKRNCQQTGTLKRNHINDRRRNKKQRKR